MMAYIDKYQEVVELSHCDNPEINRKADILLISIGLQGTAEVKVSAFLIDLAIKNVKGEITHDEVNQRLNERYGDMLYEGSRFGQDYHRVQWRDFPPQRTASLFRRRNGGGRNMERLKAHRK